MGQNGLRGGPAARRKKPEADDQLMAPAPHDLFKFEQSISAEALFTQAFFTQTFSLPHPLGQKSRAGLISQRPCACKKSSRSAIAVRPRVNAQPMHFRRKWIPNCGPCDT